MSKLMQRGTFGLARRRAFAASKRALAWTAGGVVIGGGLVYLVYPATIVISGTTALAGPIHSCMF